jgi:hypothetical protein
MTVGVFGCRGGMLRLQDEVAKWSCEVKLKFVVKIGAAASNNLTPDFRACDHSPHWVVSAIINRSFRSNREVRRTIRSQDAAEM